jgi:hypothetical protein
VTIRRSSFKGNSSANSVAVRFNSSTGLIENSTFYENNAGSSNLIGITNGALVTIRFSTFADNHCASAATTNGTITSWPSALDHVLFVGNTHGSGQIVNCNGTAGAGVSQGYNVTDAPNNAITRCMGNPPAATDLEGVDAQIVSCGPAPQGVTHICTIGAASPAANSGSSTAGACPATDQLGNPRPQGDGACDRGAYELAW